MSCDVGLLHKLIRMCMTMSHNYTLLYSRLILLRYIRLDQSRSSFINLLNKLRPYRIDFGFFFFSKSLGV